MFVLMFKMRFSNNESLINSTEWILKGFTQNAFTLDLIPFPFLGLIPSLGDVRLFRRENLLSITGKAYVVKTSSRKQFWKIEKKEEITIETKWKWIHRMFQIRLMFFFVFDVLSAWFVKMLFFNNFHMVSVSDGTAKLDWMEQFGSANFKRMNHIGVSIWIKSSCVWLSHSKVMTKCKF